MSNHTQSLILGVITYPYPSFNDSLTKLPLKVGHDLIITFHIFREYNYLSMP